MRRSPIVMVALLLAVGAEARVIQVNPGGSIQAAVDLAAPGDKVLVNPGTYTEAGQACPETPSQTCAVVVSKDRVRLWGNNRNGSVVLQALPGQDVGIDFVKPGVDANDCLNDSAHRIVGSELRGFTVSGFSTDIDAVTGDAAVLMLCADRWRVTRNVISGGLDNGIFAWFARRGRISHNVVENQSNDTGIRTYDGERVRIDRNDVTGATIGIQIDGGGYHRADHNDVHGNTVGISMFPGPFGGHDLTLDWNQVVDNDKPKTTIFGVFRGAGIWIQGGAVDRAVVRENTVTNNDSWGIGVFSGSNDVRVLSNTMTNNGTAPEVPAFGVDLAWDGTGVGDCESANLLASEHLILPTCP